MEDNARAATENACRACNPQEAQGAVSRRNWKKKRAPRAVVNTKKPERAQRVTTIYKTLSINKAAATTQKTPAGLCKRRNSNWKSNTAPTGRRPQKKLIESGQAPWTKGNPIKIARGVQKEHSIVAEAVKPASETRGRPKNSRRTCSGEKGGRGEATRKQQSMGQRARRTPPATLQQLRAHGREVNQKGYGNIKTSKRPGASMSNSLDSSLSYMRREGRHNRCDVATR